MPRKILLILIVFAIIFALIPIKVHAAGITVTINGQNVVFEQKPIVKDNTTLVPMRAFFEALGAKVDWDWRTKTVTAVRDGISIQLVIGQKIAKINGENYELAVAPQVIDGYTYVPLRFVGEALGDEVVYDNGHIIINSIFSVSNITSEKDLYILIKNALENTEEEITFTPGDSYNSLIRKDNSSDEIFSRISDIVELVLSHHPEVGYIKEWTVSVNSYNNVIKKISVKFGYIYPRSEVKKMKDEVNTKAKEIIEQIIKPGMSDIDKAKAIHDYIIKNTKYDYENWLNNTIPPESYTAYGVLIKGMGVCQGYTAAFNLLAQLAGIDSLGVSGTGLNYGVPMPHAWNMVRIDGKISYIDVTWDDPVPDQGDNVIYGYFNITEEQLAKDHSWDKEKFSGKYFDYK
ncbi:transglutaminase [Caldanaerobacter subterraneus subsp. yonseiensis KB-1]|uniref:Transglutaminase n=1 Tax=Caldanaerobacter subterraneus subsp. yonseiensis KB-1 TaxID=1388761 RepID=U5CQH1_CALSX|nr:stalk domain-containing protein [Caldanaerobacter subterraneus]ERM92034.1 transglutaminase [Caldanaerobacter subterraneus subsp. yonseiensis KB-1]